MIRNSETAYGLVTKIFHWVMALSILGLFGVGLYMSDMPQGDDKWFYYGMHKATGILVLFLLAARIVWKFINPRVKPASDIRPIEQKSSALIHWALYAMMAIVPLSGWYMSSYGGFPVSFYGLFNMPPLTESYKVQMEKHPELFTLPNPTDPATDMDDYQKKIDPMSSVKELHENMAWLIIALVVLHAGAALFHHFVRRDSVLKRMM